jgi:hypothetical protein
LLRRSLFYFDKVVWPTNNIVPQGIEPGVQFLIDEGEVEQDHKVFPSHPAQIQMMQIQTDAFPNKTVFLESSANGKLIAAIGQFHRSVYDRLNKEQKGKWVYAMVGEGVEFENESTVRGYAMNLYNVLPIPGDLVSYQDIIFFKKREHNALLDMRATLGEMYVKIDCCEDKDFAINLYTEKVKRSIATVQGLLNKRRFPWSPQSLEIDVNIAGAVSAAMDGDDARQHLEQWGVPAIWSSVAGLALTAGLIIKRKMIPSLARQSGAYLYRYAFNAGRDEILDIRVPWVAAE